MLTLGDFKASFVGHGMAGETVYASHLHESSIIKSTQSL